HLVKARMQGAAEGDVHFLEAPTQAEHRYAAFNRGLQQGQCRFVALGIVMGTLGTRRPLIMMRLNVGRRAGKQQAMKGVQQLTGIDATTERGYQQGQAVGSIDYREDVFLSGDMEWMQPRLVCATGNTDKRFVLRRHG